MQDRSTKENLFFFFILSIYIFFIFSMIFLNIMYKQRDSNLSQLKTIYSQDNKVLAKNLLGYVYYLNTKNCTEEQILEAKDFIKLHFPEFNKKNIKIQKNKFYLLNKTHLPIETKLPATIILRRENYRYYPYGKIFAHPIGIYNENISFGLEEYNKTISNKKNLDIPIRLTLVSPIQYILYKGLQNGLRKYKCKKAHGLIQNEKGEILGLVSLPSFDPLLENKSPENTMNGVIYSTFEFGSTIKVFSFILAANESIINQNMKFDIGAGAKLGKYKITDVRLITEKLTPQEILRRSSNVGTIQISELIWKKIGPFYKSLLLGQQISIDGIYKTPKGKIQYTGGPKYLYQHYCMGYSFRTGMLHVLRAFTSLMTGEMYHQSIIKKEKHKPVFKFDLSNKRTEFIINVLRQVSEFNPILRKHNVYGKTGTARIFKNGTYTKTAVNAFYLCHFKKNGKKYFMIIVFEDPKSIRLESGYNVKPTAANIIDNIMSTDL